jgi:hypothetical protein
MNTMQTHLNAGLAGAGASNVPLGSNGLNASNTMRREGDRPKLYPQSGRAKPAAAKHSTHRPANGASTSGKRPTNAPEHGDASGSQPSYRPSSGNRGGNEGDNSFVQGVMAFVQEHRRELIAGGLLLAAVLLLLSLVSYDPLDYANGKVSLSQSSAEELATPPRSRVGVPSTTLNAESHPYVVQNWLGFAGACAAQFVYHYTVGYAGLMFPVLLALWAVAYYKRSMSEKLMLGTGLALVGASLVASIVGVMQLVSWMPDFVVRPEWSGSVGQFGFRR